MELLVCCLEVGAFIACLFFLSFYKIYLKEAQDFCLRQFLKCSSLQDIGTHYEVMHNTISCPEQGLKFLPEMKSLCANVFSLVSMFPFLLMLELALTFFSLLKYCGTTKLKFKVMSQMPKKPPALENYDMLIKYIYFEFVLVEIFKILQLLEREREVSVSYFH